MSVRSELEDLVRRMVVPCRESDSSKSIAWAAHREAEQLRDPDWVDAVAALLASELAKERLGACLFILGKLGTNLGDPRCTERVLETLAKERDKQVLAGGLDLMAAMPKPASLDLSPVYWWLKDFRWLVRQAAIGALRHAQDPEAESRLLELLAEGADSDDQICCHSTLGTIGTGASIPYLERGALSRKRDVRLSAEHALKAIRGRLGISS